jgi:hypothetical protein
VCTISKDNVDVLVVPLINKLYSFNLRQCESVFMVNVGDTDDVYTDYENYDSEMMNTHRSYGHASANQMSTLGYDNFSSDDCLVCARQRN